MPLKRSRRSRIVNRQNGHTNLDAHQPIVMNLEYYQILNIEPGASIEEIDAAFGKQRMALVKEGRKSEIALLTAAYHQCRDETLERDAAVITATEVDLPTQQIQETLDRLLRSHQIKAVAKIVDRELQVKLQSRVGAIKPQIAKQIIQCLQVLDPAGIETVTIYELRGKSHGWKQKFQLDEKIKDTDTDPYSFDNRYINRSALPIAFAIAIFAQILVFPRFLLIGIQIWIHEFGHATVAWLAGHGATPLPFGWTNISENRSPIVYICVLLLMLILFWSGWHEQKYPAMIMAVTTAIVQFYMTWLMPEQTYDTLISFGGVGGEFYLSTLLIVCFYFPLPEKFRWDFWRYLFLLFATYTFTASFSMWHNIKTGAAEIPWGTMLGGQGDAGGDMNNLSSMGWSDAQIVNTYSHLGNICLFISIGFYVFFLLKSLPNRSWRKLS
jgi:hypothetical protein